MLSTVDASDMDKCESAVILKDGSTLHLRSIRADDEERLTGLFHRLSTSTVSLEFHDVLKYLSREEMNRLCFIDYDSAFGLVGSVGQGAEENIIALGRYYRLPRGDTAKVAFVVEDAYQGKGIGTHLLVQLAVMARDKGISFFEGDVLIENEKMMRMLKNSGFQVIEEQEHETYRVIAKITSSPVLEEKSAERENIAAAAALRNFLNPRSVAVIGASRRQNTIGNKLFRNILHEGFSGILYPVNPNTAAVASVKSYPMVGNIPDNVDVAIIIVPAETVPQVIEQCGRKGVKGIVVISAGFGETGHAGVEKQEELIETCRNYGMRMIGPNCMGIINTNPEVSMNATFSSISPPAGNVALCSQSGALGLAILEYANSLNIGLSHFVSIGNRADVSSNDCLQYWVQDSATDVILLYLESFGNPRKFARIARDVNAVKPIVAVKSGRTPAGSRAAASHTGALASADVASEALFKQAGITRVDTLEELFDVASLLAHQPVPSGRNVAILTNGGGPGIMTADACAVRGLEFPDLSEETISELRSFLPRGSGLNNPIDMTAEASAEEYGQALQVLARDDRIDSAIVIFVPPILTRAEEVARAIRDVSPEFRRRGKTLLASFMGSRGTSLKLGSEEEGYVPSFAFPESSAGALAKSCEYAEWLRKPRGKIAKLEGIDTDRAVQIIESAMQRKPAGQHLWLDDLSVGELLRCYGIHVVESQLANTAKGAAQAAKNIGFPVAVKLLSTTITHKTDVEGVVLGIRSQKEVEHAFAEIRQHLTATGKAEEMQGVIVQKMMPRGVEVIVGVTQDPLFGPLIMFGMGGTYAELFKDITFRIHPLTDIDVQEMVRAGKAYQLLKGWRGSRPSDIAAVHDLLLRISAMVEDLPQITELDLNPVKVIEENEGYVVVDARVMLS